MRVMTMERGSERHYLPGATFGGKGAARQKFRTALRGVAVCDDGRVYAVGDRCVKVFADTGKLLRVWSTSKPGISVALHGDRLYVGESGRVEVFTATGERLAEWTLGSEAGVITSVVPLEEDVFVADARARLIRRLDRSGRLIGSIGQEGRTGFSAPGGYLDFAIGPDRFIYATNPGKHRVERYSLEGELVGRFGRFGMHDPADFRGCCNPMSIALTRDGDIVVTEKAPPRVKIYTCGGELLCAFGEGLFDPSCKYLDVAVDADGRIVVADTVRLAVRVFERRDPPQPATPPREDSEKGDRDE